MPKAAPDSGGRQNRAERYPPRQAGRVNRGFTLVEILLAFFIFGIVAATLFASYRSVFSHTEKVMNAVSDDAMALACMQRMLFDFNALTVPLPPIYHRPKGFQTEPDPYRFTGHTETVGFRDFAALRFTSLAHLSSSTRPLEAVAEIRYFVEATAPDRFVLKRSDHPYPFFKTSPSETAFILCDRVRMFQMTFFNADGKASESWDSDAPAFDYQTPQSVRIRLEVGDETASRIFETRIHLPLSRNRPQP